MFKLHNIWVTSHSLHTEQKIFTFCPVGAKYSAFKPSDSYLRGGLKNYSTQKVITYSDSTQKIVQENVFCLYGAILNLVTKVAQTLPKSDQFMFNMHTGKCHPYVGISLGYTSFCFSRLHWCWGEEVEGWCAAGVRGFLHLHLHIAQWKVPRTAILPYFKSYLL